MLAEWKHLKPHIQQIVHYILTIPLVCFAYFYRYHCFMKNFVWVALVVVLVGCKKVSETDTSLPSQVLSNVAYGNDPEQKMDLYLPKDRSTANTKLILLIHGGGWVSGDKSDFSSYISILQDRLPGYAIANINYHLATNITNHFPTQETDVKAAVAFLLQNREQYQFSEKFVLLGASAGAHLALLQAYKYTSPKIRAVVDFYGPVNMTDLYNSASNPLYKDALKTLMGGTPAENPGLYEQSSPINFVNAQSPPTIIFHGQLDELVPVSQSENLKNKLINAGVATELTIVPNVGHDVWPESEMNAAFTRIVQFLQQHIP